MFNIVVQVPTVQLDYETSRLDRLIPELNARVAQDITPIVNGMVETLSAPPPPAQSFYPLRWASERQRRYVMWLLRSQGNLPYQRSGELEQGWLWMLEFLDNGGKVTVSNPVPYATYVQGDEVQPMFRQIPWAPLDAVARVGFEQVEDVVIQDWYLLTGATA